VVIEHHRKADVPDGGEDYHRARTVRQGDKCLSFYAFKSSRVLSS
jgi:hypothetical protein